MHCPTYRAQTPTTSQPLCSRPHSSGGPTVPKPESPLPTLVQIFMARLRTQPLASRRPPRTPPIPSSALPAAERCPIPTAHWLSSLPERAPSDPNQRNGHLPNMRPYLVAADAGSKKQKCHVASAENPNATWHRSERQGSRKRKTENANVASERRAGEQEAENRKCQRGIGAKGRGGARRELDRRGDAETGNGRPPAPGDRWNGEESET
jgi:hypothetical protein